MKEKEQNNRNILKEKKPLVYEKVIKYDMPRIQFQANYNCNFSCRHCSVNDVKDHTRKLLSIDEIKDVFDQADEMGISRLTISGGEPLIMNNLEKVVNAIGADRFYIQCDTNAYYMNEEKAQFLKDIGIDCVAPSLDSLDTKAHDEFRNQEGSALKVLEAIDIVQKVGINIYIQTVVTKSRLYSEEFVEFLRFFNDKGIGVFVSAAKPVGSFAGQFDDLLVKEDFDYLAKLEKYYNMFSHLTPAYGLNEERNCVAGKNIFGLSAYGDCLPCIYFYCSMGNVREESLKNIYDRMQRLNIFDENTCVLADKSNSFIQKYVVPLYDKKLPVNWKNLLTPEDFDLKFFE